MVKERRALGQSAIFDLATVQCKQQQGTAYKHPAASEKKRVLAKNKDKCKQKPAAKLVKMDRHCAYACI